MMKKVLLDTNLYVDWLNTGDHEALMVGPGYLRYMSAVVQMELRVGATTKAAERALAQLVRAYTVSQRLIVPSASLFDQAGVVLQKLRRAGREVRRAALLNDVLIALTARAIGATLVTRDRKDFAAIESLVTVDVAYLQK